MPPSWQRLSTTLLASRMPVLIPIATAGQKASTLFTAAAQPMGGKAFSILPSYTHSPSDMGTVPEGHHQAGPKLGCCRRHQE